MSSALTVREKRDEIVAAIAKEQDRFIGLLPKTLPFVRFEQIVFSAMVRNPDIALCTKASVVLSCMQAAELGMEVGGVLGEAFLVPFKNKRNGTMECTLIMGYQGLKSLAYQSPRVLAIRSVLVYPDEVFHVTEGTSPSIEHVPIIGPKRDPMGKDVHAAYAVVHLAGPATVQCAIGKADLDHLKATAKSAKNPLSPWHYATAAMYKKTPLRHVCKQIPLSDGLRRAIEIEDNHEHSRD